MLNLPIGIILIMLRAIENCRYKTIFECSVLKVSLIVHLYYLWFSKRNPDLLIIEQISNALLKMESKEIEQKILDEILKTERKVEEYKELTKPIAPDDAIGRVSRMDAINNKSVTEASLRKAEEKLKNLQRVIGQIGTPDFGVCLKCRQSIPIERVIIRPESLYCVNCAR